MKDKVIANAEALIAKARKMREEGKIEPPRRTIPKENSFADNMKSQEQADHFMMLLSLLK